LVNTSEITVEQSMLALQMFLHGQNDRPETWLKNGLFSPRNCPPRGTTAWHTPYSPPICIPLMAQSLWNNYGPHWKHLHAMNSHASNRLLNARTAACWTKYGVYMGLQ
jgi:hypothetical protein